MTNPKVERRYFFQENGLGLKPGGEFARLEDSPFGDDAGDQFSGRDVEGWIIDRDSGWCDRMTAVDRGDF